MRYLMGLLATDHDPGGRFWDPERDGPALEGQSWGEGLPMASNAQPTSELVHALSACGHTCRGTVGSYKRLVCYVSRSAPSVAQPVHRRPPKAALAEGALWLRSAFSMDPRTMLGSRKGVRCGLHTVRQASDLSGHRPLAWPAALGARAR